ncbi:MAG: hypothetical protein GX287_01730 [Fusobacteria bacterium]|nr:hypothetical protein [Fusobacteriota bacterium]
MNIENSEFFEEFLEDMSDLLEKMCYNLEKIRKKEEPNIKSSVNEIFRYAHSLKGMAAAMEFKKMEKLTHKMEDVLYDIREDKLCVSDEILNLFCRGHEYLMKILENIEMVGGEDEDSLEGIESLTEEIAKYSVKNDEVKLLIEHSIVLNNEIYKNLESKIKNKKKIYFFKAYINSNSEFKLVRAYMVLDALKKYGDVYITNPSEDNINSGLGAFESIFYGIYETKNIDDLIDSILKISEVQNFEVDIIEDLKKEYFLNETELKKSFEDENKTDDIINYDNYAKDIDNEIIEKIKNIYDIINDIDEDSDVDLLIRQVEENILMINEMFEVYTTDHRTIIINNIDKILKDFKNNGYKYSLEKVNVLNEYILLLENIVENIEEEKNPKTIDKINKLNERRINIFEKNKFDITDSVSQSKNIKKMNSDSEIHENIRIPAIKADILVDMLEELIVAQSQLRLEALEKFSQDTVFYKNLMKIFRITKEAQDLSISFRMITLKTIFQKVKITVRDTLSKVNKKIDLEIIGENTEIDRLVANRVLDPLLHLVKNSISHGIEISEDRTKANKPEKGNIVIAAYNIKGHVFIEVSDDGQGINIEKVHKKAIEKGIADDKKQYTDDEIVNFIMLPGFSTTESIDTISGRGVGMDVVKTEITKLGGNITIENKPGIGCKFIIKVPKNMTAMNGTVVDIAGQNFIIPTNYIKEIFKVEDNRWISVKGEIKKVKLRNTIINLIDMHKYFDIPKEESYEKIVVILEADRAYKAILVTNILERREVVVKSIGDDFINAKHIFGAAILGDGNASLILDIESIFRDEK